MSSRTANFTGASQLGDAPAASAYPTIAGRNAHHPKLDANAYIGLVKAHSKTSAYDSLYQGQDFEWLSKFLEGSIQSWSRQSLDSSHTIAPASSGFAWLYSLRADLDPKIPLEGFQLSLPLQNCIDQADTVVQGGVLLFLRGYPSPEWLVQLGARYTIDPEAFYRHLTFFHHARAVERQSPFALPSTQRSIFQLTLTFVGHYDVPDTLSISEQRRKSAEKMRQYENKLREPGYWKVGGSIVRSFAVHNKSEFSIDQLVTIYVSKSTEGRWVSLVWLDNGDDLYQGPEGPWLGSRPGTTSLNPVTMYKRSIALKSAHHQLVKDSPNPVHGVKGLAQSVSLLPLFYGRSLNPPDMSHDPFYALRELFVFYATSEIEFLNVVESGLRSCGTIPTEGVPSRMVDVQNNLEFYKNILELHIVRISETLNFLKGQERLSDWPRSAANKASLSATSLQTDFECLLDQAKILQRRCESSMSVLMNETSLYEAKRAVTEGERVYRLTLLVSIFVPLAFCAAVFSMTFVHFDHTRTGIWAFFVFTVPVMTVSILLFYWDSNIIFSKKRRRMG